MYVDAIKSGEDKSVAGTPWIFVFYIHSCAVDKEIQVTTRKQTNKKEMANTYCFFLKKKNKSERVVGK